MNLIFQLLTLLLITLSLLLIVTVPVIFAVPGQWEQSKLGVFQYFKIWGWLLVAITFFSVFSPKSL
jgi:photosystem II core protein PsbZ